LSPDPFAVSAADANCSGVISIGDAIEIARYDAGLISAFCTGGGGPIGSGDVWFVPDNIMIGVGASYSDEIHMSVGGDKLGGYNIKITYDPAVLSVDKSKGDNGVEAGSDGFVAAVNAENAGTLRVSGFDVTGKGPGADLHVLTIHWTAVSLGATPLSFDVANMFNESSARCSTVTSADGYRTVVVDGPGLDITPPSAFGLISPVGGVMMFDNTPTLIWEESSDADSGLDHYEIFIDDANVDNVGAQTTEHTTSELPDGSHSWYIKAVDGAG
ncbi:unnamed protein product, partial [marine sediment metagenome]